MKPSGSLQPKRRESWARVRLLLRIVPLLASTVPVQATAQTLQPPFADHYTLLELGAITGAPGSYGGVTFLPGDPNTLIVGGFTQTIGGRFYAVAVTRDSTGSIAGFAGPAVPFADGYGNEGGLTYGPGGVLFYTRYGDEIGEVCLPLAPRTPPATAPTQTCGR